MQWMKLPLRGMTPRLERDPEKSHPAGNPKSVGEGFVDRRLFRGRQPFMSITMGAVRFSEQAAANSVPV